MELSNDRVALLNLLLQEKRKDSTRISPHPRVAVNGKYRLPISWSQQRLLFIEKFEGGSAAYHLIIAVRLRGSLKRDALKKALDTLVMRHEVLRATFANADGEFIQEVSAIANFPLQEVDLRRCRPPDRERQVRALKTEELSAPFDLATGPLIRGRLLRLADEEHVLLITMHHIVSDGWSLGVLQHEVSKWYTAYFNGQQPTVAPLPLQYGDFVRWQQQQFQQGAIDCQLDYWRACLQGAPSHIELPTDRPRPATQSYRGGYVSITIERPLAAKLRLLADRHQISLFMVLLAGWAILLSRLSGQPDLVIGTPVANRRRSDVEGLIGLFVNMLALRLSPHSDCTLEAFLTQVREVTLAAYESQDVPFEKVVEVVKPERHLNRHPIFQAAMVLQNIPVSDWRLPGLQVAVEDLEDKTSKFDLLLSMEEKGGEIIGSLNYAVDLFDEDTATRWMHSLTALLTEITDAGAGKQIAELSILTPAERVLLIEGFNDVTRPYPEDNPIHEFFEAQVRRHPDAIAVWCEGESLTYAELNARANQLAWYLRENGVGPDKLVAVCIERSLDMVVGLLGALKAGGAYVPLDPSYPQKRLAKLIADAAPAVVLTHERLKRQLAETQIQLVALDGGWREINRRRSDNLPSAMIGLKASHLAYVIYTSGSTGEPKGAMNEHRGVVNRLLWMQEQYRMSDQDRVLQKTPFSFDVSVWEFFWTLMSGARLIIACPGGHKDPAYLMSLIEETGVTRLHFVPSMLQVFLDHHETGRCSSIRHVVCSGEELPVSLQNRCLESLPQAKLSNLYGPTECAVDVTAWECRPSEAGSRVPIGRPIANTKIYILDGRLQPVPIGVSGEIYIGGTAVGRGYLNRPGLTGERFISHSFGTATSQRMYRTGDVGRWRADGVVEYLGRNDEQVKLRGFRIELGEIEAQLLRYPQVREAAVLLREDVPGERRLAAYVTVRGASEGRQADPTPDALRHHLKAILPDFMVPSAYVVLEAFPLTANGKLDRRALPPPNFSSQVGRDYQAPEGSIEIALAGIWQELLHVERVGRHDNFFELGGHSLLGIKLLAQVKSHLGISLPVSSIFRYPSISEMSAVLQLLRSTEDHSTGRNEPEGEYEEGVFPSDSQPNESANGAPVEAPDALEWAPRSGGRT